MKLLSKRQLVRILVVCFCLLVAFRFVAAFLVLPTYSCVGKTAAAEIADCRHTVDRTKALLSILAFVTYTTGAVLLASVGLLVWQRLKTPRNHH
jgi:hypothetical protein